MNAIITPLAREALKIGFKNHYRFRVVTKESYKREWVTERVEKAPVIAQERLDLLKRSGVRFKSYIVAHEAPRLLCSPVEKPKPVSTPKSTPQFDLSALFEIVPLLFGMFFQLLLLDPAVIVELEDGTWLEVITWYD
jgi:hypothetical protein